MKRHGFAKICSEDIARGVECIQDLTSEKVGSVLDILVATVDSTTHLPMHLDLHCNSRNSLAPGNSQ